MRAHSQEFKDKIKEFGRQVDSKITFGETELGNEQLNAVTPVLQSAMLKSVMKELDIDSNVEIPVGNVVNYKLGIKLDSGDYEYLDYGFYQIYSCEKQEDTSSYNIIAYDSMLNSMREYISLQSAIILEKEFPMTVRDYLQCLCTDIGLGFYNLNDEFANYDKIIESDIYANIGYTYRDILDELAQVTASNIIINDLNQVEIKYITDTEDTIDEEYLKDINVKFGEKYGPINSIVLSRAAGSDNIYLQDEQSVADNELCELKISDNQIMNGNNRDTYLPAILEKLNGTEFYLNDFTSTGVCYYEVADKYYVKIGENTYPCVMFNNTIEVSQGLEEKTHVDLPEQAETDYTKADKTDRRLNQTYLIVDKQNQTINGLVESQTEQDKKIVEFEATAEQVKQNVTRIEQVEAGLGDTYTRNQTDQLILNASTGLTNTFTSSGGLNLLMNTVPYRIIDDTHLEDWEGLITYAKEPESINGNTLVLLNGIVSQSVEVPEGEYAVAFKWKRLVDNATLRIEYNGREININGQDEITVSDETNFKSEGNEISSNGTISSNNFTIEFETNIDKAFEIYELRLVAGSLAIPWTQNQNEVKTKSVNIGDGITIDSDNANTRNKLDIDGMVITNKTTGEEVLKATDEGVTTYNLISVGISNISGMFVKKVGEHVYVTGERSSY